MSISAKMFGFLPVMNGRITFEELKGIVCAANYGSDYNIVSVELNEETQTASLAKVFDTNIIAGSGLNIYDYRPFIYDRKIQRCYSIVQDADQKWYIINSSVDGEGVAIHTPIGLTEFDDVGGAFVYATNLETETAFTRAFYYSTNRKYIYILLRLTNGGYYKHKWVKVALSSGAQTLINEEIYDSEHYTGWPEDVETNDETEVEEILENPLYYDDLTTELIEPEEEEIQEYEKNLYSFNGGGWLGAGYSNNSGLSGGGGGGGGYYGGGGGGGGGSSFSYSDKYGLLYQFYNAGGGGGGGSSYHNPSYISDFSCSDGAHTGHGKITLNGTTYNCTGRTISINLPAGAYPVEVCGASGGDTSGDGWLGIKGAGGKGAIVTGTLILTGYTTVYITAGGKGKSGYDCDPRGGCGTGGGASDIRIGGTSTGYRVIVAGGGGGAGGQHQQDASGYYPHTPPLPQTIPGSGTVQAPNGGNGGLNGYAGERDLTPNPGYGGGGATQSAAGSGGWQGSAHGCTAGWMGQGVVGGKGGASVVGYNTGYGLFIPNPLNFDPEDTLLYPIASESFDFYYNAPNKSSLYKIFEGARQGGWGTNILNEHVYYLNTFDKTNIISATGYKTIDGETTYYQDIDYTLMEVVRVGLSRYQSVNVNQNRYSDWHDPLPFISVGGQTYLLVAKNGRNSEGEEIHTLGFLNIDTRAFISTGRTSYDSTPHIYVAPDNSYALLVPNSSNPIMLFSNGDFSNTNFKRLINIDTIERRKTLMCAYFVSPSGPPAIIDYSPASPKIYAIDWETYGNMPIFANNKIYASLSEGYYIYDGNIGKLMLTDFDEDDEPGDFYIPSFDGYAGKAWIKWYAVDDMLGSSELFEAPLIQ